MSTKKAASTSVPSSLLLIDYDTLFHNTVLTSIHDEGYASRLSKGDECRGSMTAMAKKEAPASAEQQAALNQLLDFLYKKHAVWADKKNRFVRLVATLALEDNAAQMVDTIREALVKDMTVLYQICSTLVITQSLNCLVASVMRSEDAQGFAMKLSDFDCAYTPEQMQVLTAPARAILHELIEWSVQCESRCIKLGNPAHVSVPGEVSYKCGVCGKLNTGHRWVCPHCGER